MKPKIIIGFVVILFALGFVIIGGLQETAVYYMTVPELHAKSLPEGEGVRISGYVDPESVQWNAKDIELRFSMYEESDTLSVYYKGVIPDQIYDAQIVVAEGTLANDGSLVASKILLKCPSKYETGDPGEHLEAKTQI